MPSQLTTSRAYWNLRAEQVMDRVFHEQDNHLTSARVHVHESLKAKPPQWQTLTLSGLATAGLISSVWLAHNWQASQAQLDRERNLLVMERLRKLPAASRTTSEEPSNSSSISAPNTNAELAAPEYYDAITEPLKWLGLEWDEGPYFQSERRDLYLDAIDMLLQSGKAYFCDCSREQIDQRNKETGFQGGYDGYCRDRNLEETPTASVRFRTPDQGSIQVIDR